MAMGAIRALRIAWRAFRQESRGHRVHVLIRALTCPFHRVLPAIPRAGRVLDVGSGHSLFGALIVADDATRVVFAVEPDLRKSLLPSPAPRVRKIAGFDDCVRGAFDVVSFIDTLYLMTDDERRGFFERAFARLRPGGLLVFKDMDPDRRMKLAWARFQEKLSTTFLHITAGGERFEHQTRGELATMLAGIGFVDFEARAIDSLYPHPHVLYTAKKP